MTRCPCCDAPGMLTFLERVGVPVHQNMLCATEELARSITRGDLQMAVCSACGFVANLAFDETKLSYGEDYDNNQICSGAFSGYVDEVIAHVLAGGAASTVVEVGCGKGYFLRRLVEYPGSRSIGYGFDPSYEGPDRDLDGRLRFERRFFDESNGVSADLAVCRHVIEHVAEPKVLAATVYRALRASARVFFETPCVEWILVNRVIWDFFYEHCSLFTASSLAGLFQRAGFAVERVQHRFGGQYLWLDASTGSRSDFTPARDGDRIVALANAYRTDETVRIAAWRDRLVELGASGPVAIWGAGAKGATFVNLTDPQCTYVRCVVDMNPQKQGKFIPGTGHPIVGPEGLDRLGVKSVLLMNPNYAAEIEADLRARGSAVRLLQE